MATITFVFAGPPEQRSVAKIGPMSTLRSVLGDAAARATPEFASLQQAQSRLLAAFRGQDWDGAEAALAACRDTTGPWRIAGLWELYAARIAGYRVDPPPPGWDGVVALTSK